MRHLATGHYVAFRILDDLGRGQRGRLGVGCHVVDLSYGCWVYGLHMAELMCATAEGDLRALPRFEAVALRG